eukprot:TRINITY_DN26505_c0_g1_i1.p2 TRINITY_DN26505_c0_g1~~TRINITY_DN26505_c0_g1_i1.p2  ORF type:complete len:100 (+),score=28.87 TRINITY_DN26505_c0_g1_i1:116-415(+)
MCIRDSFTMTRDIVSPKNTEEKIFLRNPEELRKKLMQIKEDGPSKLNVFSDFDMTLTLSLIHISEPTRPLYISYAVFCLKKKKNTSQKQQPKTLKKIKQ